MRRLTLIAALALAGIATADKPATAPVAPPAPAELKTFEVKTFEPKAIGLDAIEIKTKDVGEANLDQRLATKKTKAVGGEASVMRAPAKPAILEANEAEAEVAPTEQAPVAAPSNKKDSAGSR